MSTNTFEQRIGKWLRETPDLFVYRPPDDTKAKLWRPGDYMFGYRHGWGVIETKSIAAGAAFPLSSWTAQQRGHFRRVTAAGGRYLLLVRFAAPDVERAYEPELGAFDRLARGSLRARDGKLLDRNTLTSIVMPV